MADLATAVALGGDYLADIAVLRGQPDLAGPVASDSAICGMKVDLRGNLCFC